MALRIRCALVLIFLALLAACTNAPIRLPAAKTNSYDNNKVRLLKLAADNGVLFQIPDSVMRDVPQKSVGDRCRKATPSVWPEKVFSVLEVFQQNPSFMQKIHVIEFKRGDQAKAEISKDLDGAIVLVVSYSKKEIRERINSLSDIPCAESDTDLIGKDASVTMFEWPSSAAIAQAVADLPVRAAVERYNFDRRFASWLAERATVYRLTAEIAFEKTPAGESLLPIAMSRLSEQVGVPNSQAGLEYWLSEITARSNLGGAIKFFALRKEYDLGSGLQVDSSGKFARKLNGFSDPTYPYVTYKIENGVYVLSTLADLNQCLSDLTGTYRSPVSALGSFEMDPDSFMFPGHHCKSKP